MVPLERDHDIRPPNGATGSAARRIHETAALGAIGANPSRLAGFASKKAGAQGSGDRETGSLCADRTSLASPARRGAVSHGCAAPCPCRGNSRTCQRIAAASHGIATPSYPTRRRDRSTRRGQAPCRECACSSGADAERVDQCPGRQAWDRFPDVPLSTLRSCRHQWQRADIRQAGEIEISVSRLKGLGQQAPENIDLPLKWTAPILEAGIIGGEMFGFNFKLGGHIALVPGIPFRIDAAVPEQKDREIRIGGKIRANLGKVVSQGRMQGYLQAPASWQGQWIAQTTAVDVEIEGHKNRFDYGRALLLFQNGALRCLDARLCSDETTIIGNGMLLSDGRMAAITRIVAAPETLVSISRFTQPDPNATDPVHLTPLSTPQRSALDLQIFGRPGNLLYKPNPMAAPIRIR